MPGQLNKMDQKILLSKIDSIIRFLLYLLIFWLPYSSAAVEICVVFSSLLWLGKRMIIYFFPTSADIKKKFDLKRLIEAFEPAPSPLNEPIAFFLIICLVSILTSVFPLRALSGLITKTLEWFIVYFLVLEVITEKRHVLTAIGIFMFTSLATSLDSILQFHVTHRDIFNGHRIQSGAGATAGFKTSNDFGGFLAFVLPLSLILIFSTGRRAWERGMLIGYFMLVLWSLFVSLSRGSILANMIGVSLSFFCMRRKLWIPFTGALLIFIISFYLLITLDITPLTKLQPDDIHRTMTWRLTLWRDSLGLIEQKPFLGYGLNSFMSIFYEYGRSIRGVNYYFPTYAHNCYIQMVVEIGLLGLFFFLGILFQFLKEIARFLKQEWHRESNFKMVVAALVGGVGGFLGHCFVDTDLYSINLSVLFWLMVGICVSSCQILRRSFLEEQRS